ncbi:hypothetical protein J6590_013431 [Homalodisca vitripennis]|nr:hypothetical protein J6590_013431 [Homalodisca vitripennis]
MEYAKAALRYTYVSTEWEIDRSYVKSTHSHAPPHSRAYIIDTDAQLAALIPHPEKDMERRGTPSSAVVDKKAPRRRAASLGEGRREMIVHLFDGLFILC